jgi:hypothetical protein
MNIIFGDNIAELSRGKYTVLELDTLVMSGTDQTATAYAIVEKIPLEEMATLDRFLDLHTNLIKEYRKQNWKYCEDAIGHLQGKWNNEIDTFYSELYNRIQSLKTQSLPNDWNGHVVKSS